MKPIPEELWKSVLEDVRHQQVGLYMMLRVGVPWWMQRPDEEVAIGLPL